MPLIKSAAKKNIGKNIEIEKNAHPDMPIKQAAAIAYSTARQAGSHIAKPKYSDSKRHKENR